MFNELKKKKEKTKIHIYSQDILNVAMREHTRSRARPCIVPSRVFAARSYNSKLVAKVCGNNSAYNIPTVISIPRLAFMAGELVVYSRGERIPKFRSFSIPKVHYARPKRSAHSAPRLSRAHIGHFIRYHYNCTRE